MILRLIHHDVVDSTSERAFAALASGEARHGDVHVARAQTAGRGRRGSRWESPPGEGLYASLVLLPPPPAPAPAALTMATALAVRAALLTLGLPKKGLSLKWPNDLFFEGAKLCGILVETRGFEPERPHFVVGIGLNVRQRSFPQELLRERPVTSLALAGVDTTPERALDALGSALPGPLAAARERPDELSREYLAACGLAGSPVVVETGSESLHGRLRGLTVTRGIELELAGDRRASVPLEHVRRLAGE